MKHWVMFLFVLSLLGVGGCNSSSTGAIQETKSNTPPKENAQPQQDTTPKAADSKAAPAASGVESKTNANADWVGEWKREGSNESDGSVITIVSIEKKSLLFELSAFHTTNPEGTNANTGSIPHGTALMIGNEAIYHDGDFSMTMTLTNGKLNVKTNNESLGYFGHGVTVNGSYVKQQTAKSAVNSDYRIVPGESVGKIRIGMTAEEVRHLLGEPTIQDKSSLTYKSNANFLKLYLKDTTVEEIEFTSPSFMTDEGISTGNYDKKPDDFTVYEFHSNFLQLRYEWKKAGLLFVTMNADVPSGNTKFAVSRRGFIYQGNKPPVEPIGDAAWTPVKK